MKIQIKSSIHTWCKPPSQQLPHGSNQISNKITHFSSLYQQFLKHQQQSRHKVLVRLTFTVHLGSCMTYMASQKCLYFWHCWKFLLYIILKCQRTIPLSMFQIGVPAKQKPNVITWTTKSRWYGPCMTYLERYINNGTTEGVLSLKGPHIAGTNSTV